MKRKEKVNRELTLIFHFGNNIQFWSKYLIITSTRKEDEKKKKSEQRGKNEIGDDSQLPTDHFSHDNY